MGNGFKVWVTFGPSLTTDDVIREVIQAGATGFRFNFSFGTPDLHIGRARRVRDLASTLGRRVLTIADIAGEKIRIAEVSGGADWVDVVSAESVCICRETPSDGVWLRLTDFGNIRSCEAEDELVIGDGAVTLVVTSRSDDEINCIVRTPGRIESGRGLLVKGSHFSPATLTEKDINDLRAVVAAEAFDAVALSFVSSASDIARAREQLGQKYATLPIIAKIETAAGLNNVRDIAKHADYLMAARGDLALTTAWPQLAQNVQTIAEAAVAENREWILATQLVEGLEHFALPSRAEMCDLPLWIALGARGALLSHETAFGRDPAAAVGAVVAMSTHAVSEHALTALDTGYDTGKQRKLRRQAYGVTAYHVFIVIAVAAACCFVRYTRNADYARFAHLVYVVGFGAIGATLHASRYVIFSVAHLRYQRPKLLWQLLTPVHSAVLAAVAYTAGKAGLLTLTSAAAPKEPQFTYFIMASSFLVGFASEVVVKRLATAAEALFGEHGDLEGERKPSRNDLPDDVRKEDRS